MLKSLKNRIHSDASLEKQDTVLQALRNRLQGYRTDLKTQYRDTGFKGQIQ
jgi:hypothetical protein